jgi:hypothetical protein
MRKVVKLASNIKASSGDMQCGYGGRERYSPGGKVHSTVLAHSNESLKSYCHRSENEWF